MTGPRVLIVAPTLDILGGQSVQANWLLESLRREGIDAELVPINPRLPGALGRLQQIKYVRTLVTEAWYLGRLLRRLRRADIVHVFSASYVSFLLAPTPAILVAKRLYGKRVILHYHSGEAEDHLKRWSRSAMPIVRLADRVVVPSRFLADVFRRTGIDAETIANFIPSDQVRFRRRESPGPRFLANRNLEPMYNVACVLRAFDLIRRRFPTATLIVAGDGSRRKDLEGLARRLRLEGVKFVGHVPPSRMASLYDDAGLYLNASNIDNQPLSILESFAAGVPVVTTAAGGIPYLVEHEKTGLMVGLDDHEALAAQAIRILEEPQLAERLTGRARNQFVQQFRWDAVRNRWLGLYRELLTSPVRVSVVAPSTRILGGQAVQAERLVNHLRAVPHLDVSVIHVNPMLPAGLRWLQRLKYVRTVVTEIAYVLALLRHVRNADVIHVFSASYFSFVLAPTPALLIARLYGKKTVLNYRSGEAQDHLRRWRRTVVPTIRLADQLLVGSDYLVDVFGQFGLRAEAIPNIVDLDRYRFRSRESPRPAFIGNRNLEPHYDVGTILRAFRQIQDAHPKAELVLAGDGSERKHLESLARELGLSGVRFLGRVDPDDMPRLFDDADIYLNASRIDNMPTSIIEAFAAGLPVVSTSAGGIPHIVRHGEIGLLIPPGDADALASQALRVLNEPALAGRLSHAGRAECVAKYTWDAVSARWAALYTGMVAGPLASPGASGAARPVTQLQAAESAR